MQLSYFGFDVSFWQDDNNTPQKINFHRMKEYGASFVIIKAGQWFYEDPDFRDFWRDSKAAGIPRSAYWFCDKNDSGINQARKFWNAVKDDPAEGMYFADFENRSWTHWGELKSFLTEFQKLSGLPSHKIGVYTGYYYWMEHGVYSGAEAQYFAQFPLWIAWYTADPLKVLAPKPWTQFLLWQSGTPAIGLEVGVESKEVDFDWFNGNEDTLKYYMGGSMVPPTQGDTMYNCRVFDTATPYVNLRATPSGADIGDVLPGTVFTADGIENDSMGRPWLHSISPGMEGYLAAWLCSYELIPVSGKTPIKITLEQDGYPTLIIDWEPL